MATVLKTVEQKCSVSSNLTVSANNQKNVLTTPQSGVIIHTC